MNSQTASISTSAHNRRRPTMLDALGEFRVPLEATILWLHALTYPWPHAEPGKGKLVMLIPGFMAGDITLSPLANFCRLTGHRAVMSGIWTNSECPREALERLGKRLEQVSERHGGPVVVIGHSLGGVYARELGHRYPDRIERVITMGSPIHRVRDAANVLVRAVAHGVARVRGKAEGCLSESCACGLSIANLKPASVPTTVIYSRTDGVVHWETCVDRGNSPMVENVEVMSSHVGMAVSADVYKVIANRLVLPRQDSEQAKS
ncbi:MAG: esterase/lipase family protein [Candidatus Binataceae bacterium]